MENRFWKREKEQCRLINALSYFFYACRAFYPEHTCINLAISLETLFAPNSNVELSHQISYYVCRFLGNNEDERKNIYKLVKSFYNLRSQIIHGAIPNWNKIIEISPKIFVLCAAILKKILLNENSAVGFNDNKLREKIFSEFLFK